MRKEYSKPELAVERFSNEDVITVSGGLVTTRFTKDESKQDNAVDF